MGLWNFFKKHKENRNYGILRLSDIVDIPDIKDVKDSSLVDAFIIEYMKKLEEDKTYLSKDIESDEIKRKVEMYTDLITSACYDESLETASLVNLKKEELLEKKVSMELLNVKLRVYLEEIDKLVDRVNCLLIAFDEIRCELESKQKKRKIFRLSELTPKTYLNSKIDSVIETINSLMSTKITISNMQNAANLTVDTTLINIDNILNYISLKGYTLDKESEKKIIAGKKRKISKSIKALPDLEEIEIKKKKTYIVLNEVRLEEYIYSHKSLIEDLNSQILEKLSKDIIDINDWEEESKWINNVERIYKVFSYYGRDLVKEEDMRLLYEFKFEVFTFNINNPYLPHCNGFEKKVYEDIIFDMINNILSDRLNTLEIFGSKRGQAVEIIKAILKGKHQRFIPQAIARSEGFVLLLYYHRKNIESFMEDYLENYTTNRGGLSMSLSRFASRLDLEPFFKNDYEGANCKTVFKLIEWGKVKKRFNMELDFIIENKPIFYNLYLLNQLYESVMPYYQENYVLPEGMELFTFNSLNPELRKKILNDSKGKTLVCPKSLKVITGNAYFCDLKGVVLNYGLKDLISPAFIACDIERVDIPATVENIDMKAFRWEDIVYLNIYKPLDWKSIDIKALLEPILTQYINVYNKEHLRYKKTLIRLDQIIKLEYMKFYTLEGKSIYLYKEDFSKVNIIFDIKDFGESPMAHRYRAGLNDKEYERIIKRLDEIISPQLGEDTTKRLN